MNDGIEYQFNPDLGLDAEIAGIEAAGAVTDGLSRALAEQGRELTDAEKLQILDDFAPGYAYFLWLSKLVCLQVKVI